MESRKQGENGSCKTNPVWMNSRAFPCSSAPVTTLMHGQVGSEMSLVQWQLASVFMGSETSLVQLQAAPT